MQALQERQKPREQLEQLEPTGEHHKKQQRKSGKNSESIKPASQTLAWSFAGALRAPAQRFEVGSPGASLARARTAKQPKTETAKQATRAARAPRELVATGARNTERSAQQQAKQRPNMVLKTFENWRKNGPRPASWPKLAPSCPMLAQAGLKTTKSDLKLAQVGANSPNFAPSWLQVGSKLA